MALRVGVAGAIGLPDQAEPRIREQIAQLLTAVRSELVAARADPRAAACHDPTEPAALRCISSLAEGADRLFAEAALDQAEAARGEDIALCLQAILPFGDRAYCTTFRGKDGGSAEESIAAFDRLLGAAQCGTLALDGDVASDIERPRSYEAAGRMVVRNADLIVAIWDDQAVAKGRGGTRDTIEFALRTHIPVWWIDARGERAPRLLSDMLDLWSPPPGEGGARRGARALPAILAAAAAARAAHGLLRRRRVDPLFDYLAEPLKANRDVWLIHPLLVGSLRRWAARRSGHGAAPAGGAGPRRARRGIGARLRRAAQLAFGRAPFDPARSIPSQLSQAYQHRYRTSYIGVLAAAAIAVISAVIGLANPERYERISTIVEFCALVPTGILVWINHRARWHERYISYRLLGELARPARLLNALGWSLPFGQVRKAAGPNPQNWIAWLAAAHSRALPMPTGRIRDALPAIRDELSDRMLQGQIHFHERRYRECHGAGLALGRGGTLLFQATLVLVFVKMWLVLQGPHHSAGHGEPATPLLSWLSYLTAMAPAFSAVAFGLKAYEEFEPLSELSLEMSAELKQRRERVARIDIDHPLASQVLGEEVFETASIMLSEVGGWAQLFRSRPVEA